VWYRIQLCQPQLTVMSTSAIRVKQCQPSLSRAACARMQGKWLTRLTVYTPAGRGQHRMLLDAEGDWMVLICCYMPLSAVEFRFRWASERVGFEENRCLFGKF
jgi:hypothetical protein